MRNLFNKLKKWLGYVALFAACFLIFSYWTFPWERVKGRVIAMAEQNMKGYEIEADELSPSWLTGATLTNVRLVQKPAKKGEKPIITDIDELTVRAHVLPWLVGDQGLSFSADVGDGSLDGSYSKSVSEEGDTTDVELELDEVDLSQLGVLATLVALPLQGLATGELELSVTPTPETSTGFIEVRVADVIVGDGKAKLSVPGMGDGITVDPIRAGELDIQGTVKNGKLEIGKLSTNGKDLKLNVTGDITLNKRVERSRVNLLANIKFTDAYKGKSDRTKGLFTLMDVSPALKRARTKDGALQYRLVGSLGGRMTPKPAGKQTQK